MIPALPLFLVIFLEGYALLSLELLAIRTLIPFVGNGTDTVSIVIAAVLMPLAFGYYAGGRFRGGVRRRIIRNLCIAAAILAPTLSYPFMEWFFHSASMPAHWNSRILMTTLYCALFIVTPVFLLGQTVPLISNYFRRERRSAMTGRILFVSTIGSFMGAVFCTLVLMSLVGVHHAISISIACLTLPVLLLNRKILAAGNVAALGALALSLVINSSFLLKPYHVVDNNQYNLIQVTEAGNWRALRLNHSLSSLLPVDGATAAPHNNYFDFMNSVILKYPLGKPKNNILVIGAGGFTLGMGDTVNDYTFVDIDPSLKDISERYFQKEPLSPNKKFVAEEARAFLSHSKQTFDIIVVDVFRGPMMTPEHLVTKEFYEQVRSALKPGGIFAVNHIASPGFADPFSRKIDNTLHAVFPNITRQVVSGDQSWTGAFASVVYIYFDDPQATTEIYTDDKNTSTFDRPMSLP
jgi:spermidine synthase